MTKTWHNFLFTIYRIRDSDDHKLYSIRLSLVRQIRIKKTFYKYVQMPREKKEVAIKKRKQKIKTRSACSHFTLSEKLHAFWVRILCMLKALSTNVWDKHSIALWLIHPTGGNGIEWKCNINFAWRKWLEWFFVLPEHMMCSMPKNEQKADTHTQTHSQLTLQTFAFTELFRSYGAILWVYIHFLLP